MEEYLCPHCRNRFSVAGHYSGTTITCPACALPVAIPARFSKNASDEIPNMAIHAPSPSSIKAINSLATLSFVLGLLSFAFLGPVCAIPAVIVGHRAYSKIKRSHGTIAGNKMAFAGILLGYFNLIVITIPAIMIFIFAWRPHFLGI